MSLSPEAAWLENPIFAAAGEAVCAELATRYPGRRCTSGVEIVRAGEGLDHLHVLLEGSVRVYHQTPDGLEVTVKLLRAPVVYGDIELFHELPFLESVAAIDRAVVARIPRDEYDRFLDEHPASLRAHLHHLAAAFCVAARNEQQLFASLDRRIANLLLAHVKVGATVPTIGDRPALALSQDAIARSLGVVRRSVAGVLAEWTKAGILRRRGEHIVIEQPEHLQRLCTSIADSLPYWIGMPLVTLGGADAPDPGARLSLAIIGDERSPLSVDRELSIGSDPGCDLSLLGVAARHCRVFRSARGGRYWVQALSKKAPTLLNETPVTRAVLRDGDVIGLGDSRLRVVLGA